MRDAAMAAGVSRDYLYDYMAKNPSFAARVKRLKIDPDDQVEHNLKHMTRSHPVAAIFWLKNRRPDIWKDRHDGHIVHEHVEYVAKVGEGDSIGHEEKVH